MAMKRTLRAVSALGLLALAGCGLPGLGKPAVVFDNAYFYDEGGKFLPERAKSAYIALMRYHGYPVYKGMRENLWVTDYGTGQFTSVGLGARFWVNNEEHQYMLLDLYLLPGQMLAEHWHEKPERLPQKMEGWLVRHGLSHIVGEGAPNLGPGVVVPKCHMNGTTMTRHEVVARPGDFVPLSRAGTRHWQLAGPAGAILSEVANVHVGSAVRHSDPKINDYFLRK
jgi:D-lyxose ketol-isomerase